jgi:tRNA pseudouridine55 synthase
MTEGILCVDKPLELTSHDVVDSVRGLAGIRRVGHAGTLDPLAGGVLVLALGRATRLLEYVVGQPKTYEARLRLGQISDTYDGEGNIVNGQPANVTRQDLQEALSQFRGTIRQVPPMHSALKREGKPLYELARRGLEVEREAREVTIYELDDVDWDPPFATLHVVCSTGTYVRSLAHDLGQALGCGAYLSGLQRTAVGTFTLENAVPLAALTVDNLADHLRPPDRAVAHLPRLDVTDEAAQGLANGRWLPRRDDEPSRDVVRAYDSEGTFVGVVVAEGQQWRPKKIFYTEIK